MSKARVIVKGGGRNLYYVSEQSGKFYVYQGGFFGKSQIGKSNSMSSALSLIKSHSGKAIERVE